MSPSPNDHEHRATPESDASPDERRLHEAALVRLSRVGLRYTTGRRRLITILSRAATPLTVEEFIAIDPRLPMSSAYRDIHHLCDVGVLVRLSLLHDRSHFQFAPDLLGRRVLHFVCNDCARVIAVRSPPSVDDVVAAAERSVSTTSFTVENSRLALAGRCAACLG